MDTPQLSPAPPDINQLLAHAVTRVLARQNWSLQQAEIQTGIPASTINRMKHGQKVKAETVMRFGKASGESPETWGRLALGMPDTLPPTPTPPPDPLKAVGTELDPRPYAEALRQVQTASAGWDTMQRQPFPDAPGELSNALVGEIRVIRVAGECMEPVLHDGDEVILSAPDTVRDGDIVTATVDITALTCKRIRIPDGSALAYLEPINGEGIIPESRFVVTGVVRRVIESVEARLRRQKK